MRRKKGSNKALIAAALLCGLLAAQTGQGVADTADNPSLIISQVKITSHDGQFITLYNASDSALDMGRYRLEYFNSYDLGKATTSRLIALSGTVPPHGYYMINDDALLLCYQLTVDSVSLGLSSTAGMLEVMSVDQDVAGGPASEILQDYVSWSNKDAAGARTLPQDAGAFLRRQPTNASGDPIVKLPGAGSWQTVRPGNDDPCTLSGTSPGSAPLAPGSAPLLPADEPPATIISKAAESSGVAGPAMPPADFGLKAPSITELLPNPVGTGNDSADEFVELYNSNARPFDLSGFTLQTGTTRFHKYVFPKGTMLQAHSFKAFYSAATGLSLSNTGSQARLLDPFGRNITATAPYQKAKDGIAWALADGRWYWTTDATPGKANVIKEPAAKRGKSSKKTSGSKGAAASYSGAGAAGAGSGVGSEEASATTPIHMRTLVLVVALALIYGAYEYRADLADGIYRLRRHFGAGHEDRA